MTKAQLTVFVILGMLLLVSALLVAYVQTQKAIVPGLASIVVPELAQPVYAVVTHCAEQLAKTAVVQAGLQSGFVDIPREAIVNQFARIQLDSTGAAIIPSWYYANKLRIPGVNTMQDGISRFVLQRLAECINEFEALASEGYAVEPVGNLSVNTILSDAQVVVKLDWPLRITRNDISVLQKEYAATIPAPLKHLYDVATMLMRFEHETSWFENLTIDLYSSDPEVPTDGMTVDCDQKSWRVSSIRERVQSVLVAALPLVRVQNTKSPGFASLPKTYALLKDFSGAEIHAGKRPERTPEDAFEFYRLNLDASIPSTFARVGFEYRPEWGMLLNAQPVDAGWVRSNVAKPVKYLSLGCLNQWHVAYNLLYPVRVVLKDSEALNGEGFVFQYSFPVIIETNSPARAGYALRSFETLDQDSDFCNRRGEQVYDIRVRGIESGILQAVELNNVSIDYLCLNKACELGTTTADDGVYSLRTTLPESCGNPFIIASKQGYATTQGVASSPQLDLFLPRLSALNITVFKHAYDVESGIIGPAESLLAQDELSVSVRLKNMKGVSWEQILSVPSQSLISILESEAVYDVSMFLTRKDVFSGAHELVGGYINENLRVHDTRGMENIELHVLEVRPLLVGKEGEQAVARALYEGKYQEELLPVLS